jgi:non-specific serine/threonine protein kinase
LTCFQGDYAAARSANEQSLALYQELKDEDGMAEACYYLADAAAVQGDDVAARMLYAKARSHFEDSLTGLRERGDRWSMAQTLNKLGEMARVEGDYAAARSFYEESLGLRRELGDQRGMAVSLINLGYVANHQGDYRQAATLLEHSLDLFQKHGGRRGMVDCIAALAGVAGGEGQLERAARLFGAAEALREAIHIGPAANYPDRLEYDRYVAAVRAQLDEAAFAAAWAEGRAMTLEQAIECARLEPQTPAPLRDAKEKYGGLTAREREVAALIAQGKSNREIAEKMVVGVRTVETYITRIHNKLGLDSRVQVAMWAVERGLASTNDFTDP